MPKDTLDQLLIDTENELINHKSHIRRVAPTSKKIKVRSSVEKACDDYKVAKSAHKLQIKIIKKAIKLAKKVAKNDIKAHRNMIATAKTTRNAIKLASK